MKDEFDFEQDDLDFEDFENSFSFENLDDFEETEPEEVNLRTAVLSKNNMIALLCVKTATEGGAICRIDPREPRPAVQVYDDPEKAVEWFLKSLRTSRKNGWQLVYDGAPLQG